MGSSSQIKALFQRIYNTVPSFEWKFILLVGDFNVNLKLDSSRKSLLETLAKQFGLSLKRPSVDTFTNSELDFILLGSSLKANLLSVNNTPSDHKLLAWEVTLPCPESHSLIKVPNRSFAEEITHYAWTKASNTKEFLKLIEYSCKANPGKVVRIIKKKAYKKPSIQVILDASEDCDALTVIRNYFKQFHSELEDKRFSNLSKTFFKYIKKVFKYDQMDKRDGSVINSVKDEYDNLITKTDEVNKQLMATIKELQIDSLKPQPINLRFPFMNDKTTTEMKGVLDRLWNGKAITWDGVTDSIFQKGWKERSAIIFKDLWKNLNLIRNKHFESRLIPLNKIHPKVPSRKDMRPIVVNSPIVKLIEAGLMPELSEYLTKKLHPGQTGFVPGNGIFVNINRIIQRIRARTLAGKRCYGVFIDFTSAYNTLDHSILFERLLPIIGEMKTNVIQALYSRIKIRLGKESITPNQGVAQGSIISPALFNIYSEGLFLELENQEDISIEDLLGYADDLCIICDNLDQVSRVINLVRIWSKDNKMRLNERKSGIVEFISRNMSRRLTQDTFQEFPVCQDYKYLGLHLTNKLSMLNQLEFIKRKSKNIFQRLSPLIYNADLDTRKSLWQIFVQPLFEFVLPLYRCEPALTNKLKANAVIRGSFKLFTGLKPNTANAIVDLLSGYNFEYRADLIYTISMLKWDSRKAGEQFRYESLPNWMKYKLEKQRSNLCRRLPFEVVQYINSMTSMCPSCSKPNTPNHLLIQHNCWLPNLNELLLMTRAAQDAKISRKEGLAAVREIINPFLTKMKLCIEMQRLNLLSVPNLLL